MGVPGFFGWLVQHCRASLVAARKPGAPLTAKEKETPEAAKMSRTQMDCLYLDLNGVVHPCCHGDASASKDEEAMMMRVCAKVDELVELVEPTTLLFLAIDGTAPRAKMNQQRTRRFRAAQMREVEAELTTQVKQEWEDAKIPVPSDEEIAIWDSNVITPGTPFMEKLHEHLRFYIASRLKSHPAWANLTVVLTGSNEPGEGEHKIIQYIKRQRLSPGYNPDLKHCIVGEDADLIILAMSIHTPHVFILRGARPPKPGQLRGRPGEEQDWPKYNYLVVSVVVGYFERVFAPLLSDTALGEERRQLPRMLDDLALVFCLVGNDFLPHVPGMKIQHNALGVALLAYIEAFREFGGEQGSMSDAEDGFANAAAPAPEKKQKKKKKKKGQSSPQKTSKAPSQWYLTDNGDVNLANLRLIIARLWRNFRTVDTAAAFAAAAEAMLSKPPPEPPALMQIAAMTDPAQRRTAFLETVRYQVDREVERDIEEQKANDEVKVGTKGWEDRYYLLNFPEMRDVTGAEAPTPAASAGGDPGKEVSKMVAKHFNNPKAVDENPTAKLDDAAKQRLAELKNDVAREYVRGLVWVVAYYFKDCPAWGWYYPYHYAPVLGTLEESGVFDEDFAWTTGSPYTPFEQLSAVLPQATARKVLPQALCKWTASEKSPLKKYFPKDFHVDLRLCPPPWHCTVILPFIDDSVFLPILKKLQKKHAQEDTLKRRNRRAKPLLFTGKSNKALYAAMSNLHNGSEATTAFPATAKIGSGSAFGMNLSMSLPSDASFDRAAVLCPGTDVPTVFHSDEGREAFPSLDAAPVAAVCVEWPELANKSEVLAGTTLPDHSAILKPSSSCRKPSFAYTSSTVNAGLPLVLRPGRQLDVLQPHWAQERAPCWHFVNFGTCRYGDDCHFAHIVPGQDAADDKEKGATPAAAAAAAPAAAPAPKRKRSSVVEVDDAVAAETAEKPKKKAKKKKAAAKEAVAVQEVPVTAEPGAPDNNSKLYITTGRGVDRDALSKYITLRTGVAPTQVKWRVPGGKDRGEMVVRFASAEEGGAVAAAVRGQTMPSGSVKLEVHPASKRAL